jgi:glycosyltransferase involved in cell wall biosynthesis
LPRLSVIVPTRDRADLLRQALASIESSSAALVEPPQVLVVDDGAPASTDREVESVAGSSVASVVSDADAQLLRGKGRGPSSARNLGLARASGDYIAFLDDDDVWTGHHPLAGIEYLEQHPEYGAVLCRILLTDADLNPVAGPYPADSLPSGWIHRHLLTYVPVVGSMVVRASVARRIGLFDDDLRGGEDWDWALRLAEVSPIGFLDDVGVLVRQHSGARSDPVGPDSIRPGFEVDRRRYLDTMKVFRRHTRHLRARERLHLEFAAWRFLKGRYALQFWGAALAALRRGERVTAASAAWLALRVSAPHVLFHAATDRLNAVRRRGVDR